MTKGARRQNRNSFLPDRRIPPARRRRRLMGCYLLAMGIFLATETWTIHLANR